VCFDENVDRYKPAAAIVSSQKSSDLYFIYRNQVSKYRLKYQTGENPLLKYYLNPDDNKIFFSYYDKLGKLRGVSINLRQKSIEEKVLTGSKKIGNYSVKSLSSKRSFFIYSDNNQNTITFKKF